MKKKNYKTLLLLILALTSIHFSISAQEIQFTYDNYGNRVSRDIIYLKNSNSPDVNLDGQYENEIRGELSGITFIITPNPNGGQFIVELENYTTDIADQETIQLYLHNLAGDQIFHLNEIRQKNQVDIHDQPNGIYILSIVIGEKRITWKVVKA